MQNEKSELQEFIENLLTFIFLVSIKSYFLYLFWNKVLIDIVKTQNISYAQCIITILLIQTIFTINFKNQRS
jgi:hypothetical protein